MMTTGEPEPRKSKPMQCLLLAAEKSREDALRFLADGAKLPASEVDATENLDDFKQRATQKTYDLLLLAPNPSDPKTPGIVEEVVRVARSTPVLFLPAVVEARLWETVPGSHSIHDSDQTILGQVLSGVLHLGGADQARSETEDTLRTLYRAIEQAADLVLITDSSGTIEYVNPAFEKLTGYSRSEVIGQTPRILKSGEQGSDVYRELWQTILAGEIYRGVVVNRKKNGESFIVEKTITPVRNSDGQVAHFISNDRDISERRRLETALFQAQKMDAIGQLAAGVAHDFNNLLMVISSYAELMQDCIGPEHRLHRNVQEVLSASRRAADLTRQLLAFGRKQAQSLQVLDLNGILQDISRMLPRLIGEDVELVITPQVDLGRVKVDPVQIEQVVMNLAANGRDAMPRGGKLTIATRNVELEEDYVQTHPVVPAGHYVVLDVTDTGEGIDPEHLPHIFEPFYTTKEKGRGTGLGLATVYGIVKQSGGFVWVYSEPGMGTTFKIYLPRVESKVRKSAPAELSMDSSKLRGCETLLLVEDENAVRHPTFEFLKQCGYHVLEAKDGLQAVETAHKHGGKIDLLVTDVVMPGMSGGQLADLLAGKYSEMKVLFVSGYSEQVVSRHKIANVHTNFLQKPFTLKTLAAKVREALDRQASAAASAGH